MTTETIEDREDGWISLHRRLLSSPMWVGMTPSRKVLWIHLLLLANWRDEVIRYKSRWGKYKGLEIPVKRGQLIYSERFLAESAGVSRDVVRDTLEYLVRSGVITRTPWLVDNSVDSPYGGPTPYIITIRKYNEYQLPLARGAQIPPLRDPPYWRDLHGDIQPCDTMELFPDPGITDSASEGPYTISIVSVSSSSSSSSEASPPPPPPPPPPQPDKPSSKKTADPRRGVLEKVWAEEYKQARGCDYVWTWGKDRRLMTTLLGVDPDVFRSRVRAALTHTDKYKRCSDIPRFVALFNTLADSGADPDEHERKRWAANTRAMEAEYRASGAYERWLAANKPPVSPDPGHGRGSGDREPADGVATASVDYAAVFAKILGDWGKAWELQDPGSVDPGGGHSPSGSEGAICESGADSGGAHDPDPCPF